MTYAPPTMTTKQEVFDFVVRHLHRQGAKSTGHYPTHCCYRGRDGRMCAVGCLIADEHYTENLEGDVSALVMAVVAVSTAVRLDRKFLGKLQGVHDHNAPSLWARALYEAAADLELSNAAILECWPDTGVES